MRSEAHNPVPIKNRFNRLVFLSLLPEFKCFIYNKQIKRELDRQRHLAWRRKSPDAVANIYANRISKIKDGIYKIYALSDPREPKILENVRYVGKTYWSLDFRLQGHLNKQSGEYKSCWVKSLSKAGVVPIIWELERCNESNWQERERCWIEKLRPLGRLTNLTNGGDGISGYVMPQHLRERMSIRARGKFNGTDETRRKISIAGLGRKNPPITEETRQKMRLAKLGKSLSAEHRAKIGMAHRGTKHQGGHNISAALKKLPPRGPLSLETRLKIGLAHRGMKRPPTTGKNIAKALNKPVKCVETGHIFESSKAARAHFNNNGPISRAIKYNRTFAGYHWAYA